MQELKKIFKEMMLLVPGVDFMEMKERNDGKFRFPIFLTNEMKNVDLEVLELSARATNCLHRAGIHTIGNFVERVSNEDDLRRIRNCGTKSVKEIMGKIFCYQYEVLDENVKMKYIKEICKLNANRI